MEFPNIDRKRLKSYPIKENKKMSALPYPLPKKKNNDFCPYCLRGNIKINCVFKKYTILDNKISYILEYTKNEGENYENWELFDGWHQKILGGTELKAALIKKINEENI